MKSDRKRGSANLRERVAKKSKRREAPFAFQAVINEQESDEIGQEARKRELARESRKEKQAARSAICFSGGY